MQPPGSNAPPPPGACFIAADVGGTNARVALVRDNAGGRVTVLDYHRYDGAAHPGLDAILADFVARQRAAGHPADALDRMAIASAGVVLDGEVINSNLPWRIALAPLREALALRDLRVINDFAAAAHGTAQLDAGMTRQLTSGHSAAEPGPVLVIGAGTGLGAAVRIPTPTGDVVLPTEAGMSAFAPGDDREIAILRWLQQRAGRHVCTEQLLSGPGLVNLYRAIGALDGVDAPLVGPAQVSEAARAGDPLARAAAVQFCTLLGSVIGDLAVICSARAVHVAGGVVPQLVAFLPESAFAARLVDKGAMRPVLERLPVHLVEDDRLGVLGAAGWYRQQLRAEALVARAIS